MARMITLPDMIRVDLSNDWQLIASNAGSFREGLVVDVGLYNGVLQHNDVLSLSAAKDRDSFAEKVSEISQVEHAEVASALLELKEQTNAILITLITEGDQGTNKNAKADDRPGTALDSLIYTPEPSSDVVDGNQLAKEIKEIFERHIILPKGASTALTLWTLFTYTIDVFYCSPMIFVYSPLPECGKSRVLILLQHLVYKGLMASSISGPGFFRTIEAFNPTLLLDEIDTYLRERDELRGVINSGHERGTASVIRVDGESMEPRTYSTWCPKALAGIDLKSLADAPRSRSIKIEMQRKSRDQKVAPMRTRALISYKQDIPSKCLRWANDHMETLSEACPELPEALTDRAADNWEPLVAIADALGGDWPQWVLAAITALEQPAVGESDVKVQLLSDMKALFAKHGDPLASKFICGKLAELEESPWGAYGKALKPISQRQLAGLLGGFHICSGTVRPASESKDAKGYKVEDFEKAFSSYLPSVPPSQSVVPSEPLNQKELADSLSVGNSQFPTDRNIHNPNEINCPDGTTDRKGGEEGKKSFDGDNDDWNSLLNIADDQANSARVIEEF